MAKDSVKKDPHGPLAAICLVVFVMSVFYFIIVRILRSDESARRVLLKPLDDKKAIEYSPLLSVRQAV